MDRSRALNSYWNALVVTCTWQSFHVNEEYMLDSYVRLLFLPARIRESLCKHEAAEKFFSRLKHPKTSVRKLLLQILQLLLRDYPRVSSKAEKQLLLDLERNDSAVMIRELTGLLLRRERRGLIGKNV